MSLWLEGPSHITSSEGRMLSRKPQILCLREVPFHLLHPPSIFTGLAKKSV